MTHRLALLCLILVLALGLPVPPLVAEAQPTGKVAHIGVIGRARSPFLSAFLDGLRELGWTEGQNIKVQARWAQDNPERLPELAAELVALRPDVIVALTHRVALVARNATATIPIVFGAVNDPVGVGLVPSLGRPAGNVTGLSLQGLDLIGKRLELLREAAPAMTRVAYLRNPDEPYSPAYLRELERAASSLGLKPVLSVEVRGPKDFEPGFSVIRRDRPGGFVVEPNELNFTARVRIAAFAKQERLPSVSGMRQFAEAGGLMSYGPVLPHHYRRLAYYVDRILRGAKPADLPVEQPTTFELVVNLKTAKALGLTMPPSVLIRADEVIR